MIYIIYSFDDYPLIKPLTDEIRRLLPDTPVFLFEPDRAPRFWHPRATRHLRKSHLVLVFEPLSGEQTEAGKHISWEIRKAEALHTRMVAVCRDPAHNRLSHLPAVALDLSGRHEHTFHRLCRRNCNRCSHCRQPL